MSLTESILPKMKSKHPNPERLEVLLTLFGHSRSGKSSFARSFVDGSFSHEYEETVEESYTKKEKIDNIDCTFKITDPGGAFNDDALIQRFAETASAFLLIYAINDEASFSILEDLVSKLFANKGTHCFPIVILGNKCDLEEERAVPFFQGFNLARKFRIPFLEISCLKEFNIRSALRLLIRNIIYFSHYRYSEIGNPGEIRAMFKICVLGLKSTQKFDFVFQFIQKYGRNPVFDKHELVFDYRIFCELSADILNKFKVWFLAYSTHDTESFQFVKESYEKIVDAHAPRNIPIVFVGLVQNSVAEKRVLLTDSFLAPFVKKKQAFEVVLGNIEQVEIPFFNLFKLQGKSESRSCFVV